MDLFTRRQYRLGMEPHGPYPYQVNETLVVEAMRRHMLRRLTTGLIGRLFIAVLVMLALLIVLDLVAYGRLSGTAIAFVVAVPAMLAINHIWLVPNLGRRQHRQSAALRLPSHIAWDAEGVLFTSERGEARVPFADLYRWDETPGTVLLYQTEMFFNLVPKAALNGAASDLIARLQAAGVKRN